MAPDDLEIREAQPQDLPAIVRMLADDHLGTMRERFTDPLPESYYQAFRAIASDPNNIVIVAALHGEVVGTLQITYSPSISYQGGWRATVESVRTDASLRGRGIGAAMMNYAIDAARARGCVTLQLTTHASRTDAQRFYRRLGFEPSHVGMKLPLK